MKMSQAQQKIYNKTLVCKHSTQTSLYIHSIWQWFSFIIVDYRIVRRTNHGITKTKQTPAMVEMNLSKELMYKM